MYQATGSFARAAVTSTARLAGGLLYGRRRWTLDAAVVLRRGLWLLAARRGTARGRRFPGRPRGGPAGPGLGSVTGADRVRVPDNLPRYHLDIETDDIPAEVTRLLDLGAAEISTWAGCHPARPRGHLVCVSPVHSEPADFTTNSHTWP